MKPIVAEHPDSPEAELLRAASGTSIPAHARRRAAASLTLAASTLTSSGTAAATGIATATWIKGALALVVVAVSAAITTRAPTPHPAASSMANAAPAESVAPRPSEAPSTDLPAPVTAAPDVHVAAHDEEGARPKNAQRARLHAQPSALGSTARPSTDGAPAPGASIPSAGSSLPDEVARLQLAKNATQAGRGGEALTLLDAYAAAHPRGRLAQEAESLRIRALVVAGRRGEAAAKLRTFRAAYPSSPHTALLEALIAE